MSAWGLGRSSGASETLAGEGKTKAFVDRVVQWIPADVIGIYTVGITTLKIESPDPNPSPLWLVIAAMLGFALVLIGARASRHRIVGRDIAMAVAAVVAFAIWSLAIPESGWYHWHLVADHPGWVALVAAVGGILFGAFAEALLPLSK